VTVTAIFDCKNHTFHLLVGKVWTNECFSMLWFMRLTVPCLSKNSSFIGYLCRP